MGSTEEETSVNAFLAGLPTLSFYLSAINNNFLLDELSLLKYDLPCLILTGIV